MCLCKKIISTGQYFSKLQFRFINFFFFGAKISIYIIINKSISFFSGKVVSLFQYMLFYCKLWKDGHCKNFVSVSQFEADRNSHNLCTTRTKCYCDEIK